MANAGSDASNTQLPQTNSSSLIPPLLEGNHSATLNLTQISPVKLDRNNFLLWKNMVMPIIKGHNLEGFITETKECPPEFIGTQVTAATGVTVEMTANPEYGRWMSVDQLLMGWMYSSMTPDIAMRVMGSTSSCKLWNAVLESFGVMNKSRITFLIGELQRTRKGVMNIDQYLSKMKHLADNFEIAGKATPHNDLITQVLAVLDEEYTPIVVQINSRESITWHELQSLMTYESRIEHLNSIKNGLGSVNLSQASASFVQRSNSSNFRGNFRSGRSGYAGRNGRWEETDVEVEIVRLFTKL